MLARLRKTEGEGGFTLIELLVVMIIIGILAAIAIPVFLSQRATARDTSTKADVSTAGKEIATYFVDGRGTLAVTQAAPPAGVVGGGDITIAETGGTYTTSFKVSKGTVLSATPTAGLGTNNAWCVSFTNGEGKVGPFAYKALNGLVPGTC